MAGSMRIGQYLIRQLHEHGVRHVFGIPGDYVLGFFDQLSHSQLAVINTCDEQGAGFAADAYARVNGLGAVCITYGVGGLKIVNTTAQAFAEKSPVVVISGAPGLREQLNDPLLHHRVRGFDTQLRVFEQITVATTVLNDPTTALAEIDRVLHAAQRHKRPVYIELPRDMVDVDGDGTHKHVDRPEVSDPNALREALREAAGIVNAARRPVILAGVELHRFGLQEQLRQLVDQTNIPVAAMLLGKSVIREDLPQFLGVYEGAMGTPEVRQYVESCDCTILLGAPLTDLDTGIFTARLDPGCTISATQEKLAIQYHQYPLVSLRDFVARLLSAGVRRRELGETPHPEPPAPFVARQGEPVTIQRLFQRLNAFLTEKTIVVADVGNALFGAADLFIRHENEFLACAYYSSMGFAVPGSLGVQLARPDVRPLVLVGDGAFQMTGMEISSAARYGVNPIVVVLNNAGYGTERPMLDGPYNDVQPWRFSRLPDIVGAGCGFHVETEDQLDRALQEAQDRTDTFSILDVHLQSGDMSPALHRLTEGLGARVR